MTIRDSPSTVSVFRWSLNCDQSKVVENVVVSVVSLPRLMGKSLGTLGG
jgi:hypothetical protein